MRNKNQFILYLIAIGSFILYGIGIYLHVGILGQDWGNVAVEAALQVLGPLVGVLIVILVGALILLITFFVAFLRKTNVFLCWFWILSLYQCAINSFLQFYSLPDEPINQFFKIFFPNFWYPAKELFFLVISLLLTYFWVKKVSDESFAKLDLALIILAAFLLVGGTIISQIFLM
ncbi:MAG: hypothetical protein ACTSQQ_01455 [Candidatus Helarchaeota archaeon]